MLAISPWLLAVGCQRVEEPTSTPRPPQPTYESPSTAGAPSSSAALDCPMDPDATHGSALFTRGTATFVLANGQRRSFTVEVAKTEEAQRRGLMYRTELRDDAGMVFVFEQPHPAVFWMHNTCIALDMVFVGEEDQVIGVVTAPPLNDAPRSVPGYSRYVVELPAGVAGRVGITLGSKFVPPTG